MAQGFSLADQLFNVEKVAYLGGLLHAADRGFDAAGFQARVMARLPQLELKQRIVWIAEVLQEVLPETFDDAAALIEAALPAPCDPTLTDDDFGDFIFAPFGEYAVARGLEAHRDRALDLLEAVTQRFSMEYAIRPFLNHWPDETYQRLAVWAGHPHYHVRRLVSEGTRPKLPWGMAITVDPHRALPLLDHLHADPTRFVVRSVANHMNDISKIDTGAVLSRLQNWHETGLQGPDELRWMTRHALRTLVKQGHPEALKMLGYGTDASVKASLHLHQDRLAIGEVLTFEVTLEAAKDTPVLVDYILSLRRANGTLGRKVFKLKQGVVRAGHPLKMQKTHRLKGDATTFRLFAGTQKLAIQVNGKTCAEAEFSLT